MRYSLLLLTLIALVLNSGCNEPHDPSRVRTLDSLITELEVAQQRIDSLDMERIRTIGEEFAREKKWMENQFTDTLERDEAIFLGNFFRQLRKPMARLLKGEGGMDSVIEEDLKSLNDLHHDINKGLLEADMESAYFSQEKLRIERTLASVEERMRDARTVLGRWELEHEQVHALIDQFKAEQSEDL